MRRFKTRNPWQSGLIAATALSAVGFYARLLDQTGYAEWAFLLLFIAGWCLIALFWANDGFNEESGMLLAETLDRNVEFLHRRLLNLEQELAELRDSGLPDAEFSPELPRSPVSRDEWV